MKRKLNPVFAVIILCAIAAVAYFIFGDMDFSKKTKTGYPEFYQQVQEGQIETVKIFENKIEFKKKDSDQRFVTENPESSTLKETLLLNGVEVNNAVDGNKIFDTVLDVLFYIFVAAVAIFLIKKFFAPTAFKVVRKTGVTFNDVVGMDGLKKEMKKVMEIMKNPEKYAKLGVRMPKGILLEGAPGNGKTLFARALAGECRVNFIPTKATDFESMFMAIGPMKIKTLFAKARRLSPCIIFIDEFDGIGTRRNYSGSAIETENTRMVTALLNELDGFKPNSGILVIAATNNIHSLDEALVRPGRFDARVSVPYPDANDRLELIKMYAKDKKLDENLQLVVLAEKFKGFSAAKIESVLNKAAIIAEMEGLPNVSLKEIDRSVAEIS